MTHVPFYIIFNFSGGVTEARKYMRTVFSDFCMNKDNQLVDFWNSICHEFEAKEEAKRQKEIEMQRQIQEEIDSVQENA